MERSGELDVREAAPLRLWLRLGRPAQAALAGVAWFGAAKLGHAIAPVGGQKLLPFFPASGLLLALLLLTPRRRWPAICAGAAAAVVAYNLPGKGPGITAALLAADLVLPLLGASIVLRACGGPPDLSRLRHMATLLAGGALVAPAVAAAIAAAALSAHGGDFTTVWVISALSNAGGVLLVTPLIVSWARGGRRPTRRELAGLAAATLLTAGLSALLFFGVEVPLVWIALIVPAAVALRGGVPASSVAVLPWVVIAVVATREGHGLYAQSTSNLSEAVLYAQAATATGLLVCDALGAVAAQLGNALRRLRLSEESVRLMVEGVRDHAMFTTNGDGRITSWNAGATRMLGHGDADVLDQPVEVLLCRSPERAGSRLDLGDANAEQERWVRRADGSTFLGSFAAYPVRETAELAVVLRDVTEARRAEQELRHMALHDALTGLPNRSLLEDRLSVALSHARREHRGVAVLFCDLDRFKVINDSLGHAQGDEVLRQVAGRLRAAVRPGDTVARFGGDEFVLACHDVNGPEEAVRIADRIAAQMAQPLTIGEEVFVSASIGIAMADRASTPADLISGADAAMYRAKERGGGHALVEDGDREHALGRLRAEADIRRACERDELVLHYQPIVNLESGRAVAIEALMRWNHPERGLLSPGEFIRLAEDTGAIVDMGMWALEESCRAAHRLREHARARDLRINVNVSARQLADPAFVERVGTVLGRTVTDPRTVCIELTETTLIEDLPVNEATLAGLKGLGIQIAMDDFGIGYSSLAYLRRLPIDQLKLDRSFVTEIDEAGGGAPVLRAAVAMAEALEVELVAEGVEEYQQVAVLGNLGCSFAQGYHFARPGPEAEMEAWLRGASRGVGQERRLRVVE